MMIEDYDLVFTRNFIPLFGGSAEQVVCLVREAAKHLTEEMWESNAKIADDAKANRPNNDPMDCYVIPIAHPTLGDLTVEVTPYPIGYLSNMLQGRIDTVPNLEHKRKECIVVAQEAIKQAPAKTLKEVFGMGGMG